MKFRGLARVNERAARLKRYLQITKALSEDALGAIKLLFDDRKTEATVGCRTLRCHALPARIFVVPSRDQDIFR
jgi:hypothetical protein